MTDTSGPKFCEPFAHYDRDGSCWRTSEATFPWGSDEFSETWPKAGTWDLGFAYERPMLAHPTPAPESSSLLPTPTARDNKQMDAAGRAGGPSLCGVFLLPTPTAGDSKASRNSTAHRNKLPPTGIHAGDTLLDAASKFLSGDRTPLRLDDGNESSDDQHQTLW